MKPRALPVPAAPVAPVSVTQDTAPATCGVTGRRFLELVRELDIPHTRAGQLVLVLVTDWCEALKRASSSNQVEVEPSNDTAPALDVDSILASVGRRRRV